MPFMHCAASAHPALRARVGAFQCDQPIPLTREWGFPYVCMTATAPLSFHLQLHCKLEKNMQSLT